MRDKFFVFLQSILPQHLLTKLVGRLAESKNNFIKNTFIRIFIKRYNIDLTEADQPNPLDYASFNEFFIRKIKSDLRPIGKGIISPADGVIAEIGHINSHDIIHAKDHNFTIDSLLGDKDLSQTFRGGSFATIYLAPHNYHRVHMPYTGRLLKTIYIPGKLFSVNRKTAALIKNFYGLNERLITIFETDKGLMAIILVGAMIVGSIKTAWLLSPIKNKNIVYTDHSKENILLQKGEELGYFKMGSTVILLFEENKIKWLVKKEHDIKFGEDIAYLFKC